MKTDKLIYSVIEQCTGKIPSDDTRLSERFVLHQLNIVRATLIKDYFDKEGKIEESNYQLKCCIPVECERIICNGLDSGEKVWYSPLPDLIEGVGWKNITYFGNVEFGKINRGLHNKWDRYNFNGWLSVEYQEWIGRRPAYTIIGGYKAGTTEIDGNLALLKNIPNTGARSICVLGLFVNPEEGLCDEEDIMQLEYPISSNLIYKLQLVVIKQILSTEPMPGDDTNNANDNTANIRAEKGINVPMNNPNDYGNQQQ